MFLFQININADYSGINATPSIIFEGSSESYPIDLVDAEREENKIILYTKNYGEFTKPFGTHTHEYVIVNDIIAQANSSGANGTYIPPSGYVISYTGNDEKLIGRFAVGASLTLSNMDIPVSPDMYFILEDMLIPIDQVNTVRDANRIVLYNSAYGTSTKTNPWGMELTVADGIITGIADMTTAENNSQIPTDGVVISIHSGSPYYKQVQEKAKQGGNIKVSADAKLYNASKIKYAAYNPMTIADNPAAWDMDKGKPYDSFRGPEQLIIYDSSYGESTGTNPYGYEVAVNSEGKITSTGGNDSEIPEGGYILSGHGESLKWLQKYALLGSTVITDPGKKEVTIILTPDSYMSRASLSIESAQDRLDLARLQYLDIPYDDVQEAIDLAAAKLANLNKQIEEGQYENLGNTVQEIQKSADKACFMTFESVKTENRAVWIRPRDTNANDVKKRFDMLESININTIYLETHWNGYTIYPTDNELMEQNPMFKGFDVLASYLKEAHSRGIEVHAWVENFLVALPIAEKKPEWLNISRKGDNYYLENGVTKYYFMNPALPQVRDFLSELYKNLVKKYNIDGIQFDYLRYPNSGDYTNDFGYDTYTRQLFMDFSGSDPIALKPGDPLWQKWCEFREYITSSYACRIFSELKSLKPQIHISADIWPDYDDTLADIYQNPKTWVNKDYINTLIPMSYYLNEKPVVDDLVNSWAFSRGHSQVSSGIATFNKVDTKMLIKQIDAARASNASGVAIFEYESLFNGDYADALKLGTFSTPSAVTNKDPEQSIKAILNDIVRKLDDIYLKNNGIDNSQRNKYKGLIEKIQVNFNEVDKEAVYSLKNDMQEMLKSLNCDENLNEEVSMRISADLNRAINIIDGYIANTRFKESHRVKEFQVELPLMKVKAIFDDNTVMYLDRTQYTVHDGQMAITIDISDSFKFNTVKDLNKRIEFTKVSTVQRALRASETGYSTVMLEWGSTIIDPGIAGFILYRNDKEILRTSSHSFRDDNLHPDETYTYEVHGFDASGNIVYESDPVTVKTRAPLVADD
jgi:uncharacterized lipoprotein YddW (UPF0748 family)